MNTRNTLYDYLKWRKDLTFKQSPFNTFDAMIFSELAYVNFESIHLQDKKSSTIGEALTELLEKNAYDLRTLNGGHIEFFQELSSSVRYKDIIIHDFVDIFETDNDVQFSAICFDLDKVNSFIAYRGTDSSLVGWKEDLMISFTRTKSQTYSVDYANKVMKPLRKYYFGGHSKGGNLVIYACANLSKDKQKQIKHIYDLDGPGFCDEVFNLDLITPLKKKVTKIIPEFCVIGKIYELDFENTTIVKSNIIGIYSHDQLSWNVSGLEFIEAKENQAVSNYISEVIMAWATSCNIEEREIFVNEFFGALEANGAKSIDDLVDIKQIIKTLEALSKTSPTAKKMLFNLAKAPFLIHEE